MHNHLNNVDFHPIQFQFIGRVGAKTANDVLGRHGFVAQTANITTAGIGGLPEAVTPVDLVSLDLEENRVVRDDVYSISCKLIGSNSPGKDRLHFKSATRIHLGNGDENGIKLDETFVNKIAMTALGTIVSKESTTEDWGEGDYPLIITLKSVDVDPVTQSRVVCVSKHHISPLPGLKKSNERFNVGQEVQISGMVKGYDKVNSMWHTEVSWITTCTARMPGGRLMKEGHFRRRGRPLNSCKAHHWQQIMRRYNAKHGDPARIRLMNKDGFGAWRGRQIIERQNSCRRNSIS